MAAGPRTAPKTAQISGRRRLPVASFAAPAANPRIHAATREVMTGSMSATSELVAQAAGFRGSMPLAGLRYGIASSAAPDWRPLVGAGRAMGRIAAAVLRGTVNTVAPLWAPMAPSKMAG